MTPSGCTRNVRCRNRNRGGAIRYCLANLTEMWGIVMSSYETMQRPSVVTAASVLLYVFAGFSLLGSLILMGLGATRSGLGTFLLVYLLVVGIVYIVLATKILGGSNGARITTIVLLSISIVLNVVQFDVSSFISIGLGLLVIGLLSWNRDAQEYFRSSR
jgi:DMSO/TMAO reductase YedYZ heme-binding membrane subunit